MHPEGEPPRETPPETTGDLLAAVNHRLRRSFAAALAAYDVTPGQVRALRAVADRGPARLSTLADDLRIAPRSATEVVDALEQRGLVARSADPTDRRAIAVTATPEGLRLRARVERVRADHTEALLVRLSPADRNELDRLLRLLAAE